jgi:hypothetical protein
MKLIQQPEPCSGFLFFCERFRELRVARGAKLLLSGRHCPEEIQTLDHI